MPALQAGGREDFTGAWGDAPSYVISGLQPVGVVTTIYIQA